MTLAMALNTALTGLNINQKQLSVLSNNVTNANTEGYSRQIVDQSPVILNGEGVGVRIDSISRKVDIYLKNAIKDKTQDIGRLGVLTDYMERIQIFLGEPGGENSLDEYVENFFNAVQGLADTPERTSARTIAVGAGETLANRVSQLALELESLRFQADQDLDEAIDNVNFEVVHLFNINLAINQAVSLGNPTASLLDERDLAIKKIAEEIDIQTFFGETGDVQLSTANGVSLLDDQPYKIQFTTAPMVQTFVDDGTLRPIEVVPLDPETLEVNGNSVELVSGGVESAISHNLSGGRIRGLLDLRDVQIPAILSQLDTLAGQLRDEFNAIHNDGSGYPGAGELTGTRMVTSQDQSNWTGSMRIGVLDAEGQPLANPFGFAQNVPEVGGRRPLTLDFDWSSGGDPGQHNVQTIIDEINAHFAAPQPKLSLLNMNDIRLVATQDANGGLFEFDFELENISDEVSTFQPISFAVNATPQALAANPFTTTGGSTTITVADAGHTLVNGDEVIFNGIAGTVDGIPSAELNGLFTVSNVVPGVSFDITTTTPANLGGAGIGGAGITYTPYDGLTGFTGIDVEPGEKMRTGDNVPGLGDRSFTIPNPVAAGNHTIDVHMRVTDDSGNTEDTFVRFEFTYDPANQNVQNDRYFAAANPPPTGLATRDLPNTGPRLLTAQLVDANGNPVAEGQEGFLQLTAFTDPTTGEQYRIHIDELDSQENGLLNATPPVVGSGRGFSHFFELNNFFVSNEPTATGDTTSGSAINMAVTEAIADDASLITTGQLSQQLQSADPDADPVYSYERNIGDNRVAQRLAELSATPIEFGAAGGLPATTLTFVSFTGEFLAQTTSRAVEFGNDFNDTGILLEGFQERSSSFSGVNLDEEMANTIIFQNAYTASARVITVTDELFQELLNMV